MKEFSESGIAVETEGGSQSIGRGINETYLRCQPTQLPLPLPLSLALLRKFELTASGPGPWAIPTGHAV